MSGKALFLVKGCVVKSEYMCDSYEEECSTHLVLAETSEVAEAMFHCYYERLTQEYDTYYRVYGVEAVETISIDLKEEEKVKYGCNLK